MYPLCRFKLNEIKENEVVCDGVFLRQVNSNTEEGDFSGFSAFPFSILFTQSFNTMSQAPCGDNQLRYVKFKNCFTK